MWWIALLEIAHRQDFYTMTLVLMVAFCQDISSRAVIKKKQTSLLLLNIQAPPTLKTVFQNILLICKCILNCFVKHAYFWLHTNLLQNSQAVTIVLHTVNSSLDTLLLLFCTYILQPLKIDYKFPAK